jgi:hypothetical protein
VTFVTLHLTFGIGCLIKESNNNHLASGAKQKKIGQETPLPLLAGVALSIFVLRLHKTPVALVPTSQSRLIRSQLLAV